MKRLGSFDVLGCVVDIRSSEPLAVHLGNALAALACRSRRHKRTLSVEAFRNGTWSVSWPDEQRYEGPDASVAFYDVFGALNDVAARYAAGQGRVGLHGGAVSVDGHGVAVVGHSGVGKSTLTAGLVQAGHGFVSDEIGVVERSGAGPPMLCPFHRPIGMRPDGAEAIGVAIPDGPFDFTYPLPAATIGALAGPTPLDLIGLVERQPGITAGIDHVSPAQALHRLSNHTLGTRGLERETFPQLDRLVRAVPAVAVRFSTVAEGVKMIEQAVAANGRS